MSDTTLLFVGPTPVTSTTHSFGHPLTSKNFHNYVSSKSPSLRCKTQKIVRAAIEGPTSISKMAEKLDAVPSELRSSLLRLPEEADLAILGARHTKIVATIGTSTSDRDKLLRLMAGGMNIARLNLCHRDNDWHRQVINHIREINLNTPFVAAVMIDVGSFDTVRVGEFARNPILKEGDTFTLTVRHQPEYPDGVSEVSYDGFINIAQEGDLIQCQAEGGGTVEMIVNNVSQDDVICEVMNSGELRSRGTINIRGKSMNLSPAVEDEDFNTSIARRVLGCPPEQLEFAIQERVEYVALSFVESADQVLAVRSLFRDRRANIGIIAKIESPNALRNLESIMAASDGVMVARGDLGTAIHYEKVPYWQEQIADACRRHGKPCLVSTHFLDSMVKYPTPTRAEVTDMTEAVKQRVDALVLTAETATGLFPFKAMSTMDAVIMRTQKQIHELESQEPSLDIPPLVKDPTWWTPGVGDIAENIASTAAVLANQQEASAVLVFTQKGLMATLASRCRPMAPIFAFTATPVVRNKLNMLYGVRPFRIQFEDDPEETIENAMEILKERKAIQPGDMVIILADVLGGIEGATEAELKSAFTEVSKGGRFITGAQVRNALRILGLKVSDKLEAQLGMREEDIAEAGKEIEVKQGAPAEKRSDRAVGQYNFERFHEIAAEAKEIVHTLQLRNVS